MSPTRDSRGAAPATRARAFPAGAFTVADLGLHLDDAGLCAVCGTAWPCERTPATDVEPAGL
jgi:hypothetical protein